MQDLDGKVAVVTGGGSGIGRALSERFAREGMKVVLADIEQDALDIAVGELRQQEYDVLGVQADVSSIEAIERLARETLDAYGKVHIVCNNAGVLHAPTTVWEASDHDWRWMMNVNVWSIIHGIRTFIPIMLDQDEEAYMVNTASIAGLGMGRHIYSVTKHAVVSITEALYNDLQQRATQQPSAAKIGVSVLCPTFVQTRIIEGERNRPQEMWNDGPPPVGAGWDSLAARLRTGTTPEEMANEVLRGIQNEQFYIIPDDWSSQGFETWAENLVARRNPALPV